LLWVTPWVTNEG